MKENKTNASSSPCIAVLMYHRIDAIDTNPWGVCVSPECFEEQIRFVSNHFNIVTTHELVSQLTKGGIEKNSVCITFDDGYADNYTHAKPILETYHCPATFFISTHFINKNKRFWCDELEMILLHSKQLPPHLSLLIDGQKMDFTFEETELTQTQWQQHIQWKWYDAPPTARCAAFLAIWEKLRPLFEDHIEEKMTQIKKWAGSNQGNDDRLPMNETQLREMATNPLFTLGLHTHTHPDLAGKEKRFQTEELLLCKKTLKHILNIESRCVAYPYGRYDDATLEAVSKLGIAAGFTTEQKVIDVHSDIATLSRFQVFNWNAQTLKVQLNVWFANRNTFNQ